MKEIMKEVLICPVCMRHSLLYIENALLQNNKLFYRCNNCNWDSRKNTADISYKDNFTAPLSNLFPHKFVIDGVKCQSM